MAPGESRAEPPRASGSELALFPDSALIPPDTFRCHGAQGRRGGRDPWHILQSQRGTCCPQSTRPQRGHIAGQGSTVREGAGASLLHPHRPVPTGTPSPGVCVQEAGQEPAFGASRARTVPCADVPAWTRCLVLSTAPPVLQGTNAAPAPCPAHPRCVSILPGPGCSWQLQQSPAGMCQAGESCQPRAHLCWVHRKRGGLHGPRARGRRARGAQHPGRP